MCRNSLNMLTWLLINNVTEKLVFYLREREEASTNYNKKQNSVLLCIPHDEVLVPPLVQTSVPGQSVPEEHNGSSNKEMHYKIFIVQVMIYI